MREIKKTLSVVRSRFLQVVIVNCFFFTAHSQASKNIPLSPNAASILQYGNIPIGLYTGQANISLPIYEINTGYVKVPISLSYNYNGLKVEDYPGWVGTGWTLNTPGVISRQGRSLPDESTNGFNGENKLGLKVKEYLESNVTPISVGNDFKAQYPDYYALLKGIVENRMDGEPDMFNLSIPGYSGKFYFDESQCNNTIKTAKIIPHQNITIKGHFDYSYSFNTLRGQITKFEITDERGNVFTFDIKETNRAAYEEDADDGSPDLDFQNTWYLSTIEDPFNHVVRFQYKPLRKIAMPPTIAERIVVPKTWTATPVVNQSFIWEQVLERITFRNGVVEFIEEEENNVREDWDYGNWHNNSSFSGDTELQRPRALSGIRVSINGKVIKETKFKYSYFGGNARLRLDSFQEVNGSTTLPPYEFSYKEGRFPRIGIKEDLFSQDHWGYYTGGGQTTLLPPIHLVADDGSEINVEGNFRTPMPEIASAGILTSIQYPTGGNTFFEYEPNTYHSASGATVPVGSCSQEFTSKGTAALKKETGSVIFPTEDTKTIIITGPVCARIEYSIKTGDVVETSASVWLKKKDNGLEIFNHTQSVTSDFGGTTKIDFSPRGPGQGEIFSLLPGEYELAAYIERGATATDPSANLIVEAKVNLFTTSAPDGGSVSGANQLAGGMRVKKITDCSIGMVSGCVSKYFNYHFPDQPESSSGSLVSSLYNGYWTTLVVGNTGSVNTTNIVAIVYDGNSILPVVNTMGNSVGYQYVTMEQIQGGGQGKSIYKYTSPIDQPNANSSPVGIQNFPFPPAIERDHRRGFQLLQQDYLSSRYDIPLKETAILPTFSTISSSLAVKTGLNFEFSDNLSADESVISIENAYKANLLNYTFAPYKIQSSVTYTSNQKETLQNFDNNQATITETDFFYENPDHNRVTRKETKNSIDEIIATKYAYQQDAAGIEGISQIELDGILACPDKTALIEEKNFKNETLLATKRNLYNGSSLEKIQQSIGSAPLENEILYTAYDTHGNPLSITTKTGELHSYGYGYSNTLPIAYARNSSYGNIFFESFEEGAAGSLNSNSKSGEKVLSGDSFTFPTAFVPTNLSSMRMSYWYWSDSKWNFSGEIVYSTSFTAPGTMIDEVRAYPAGARMTTFCYQPGVGMTTRTDENNITQYFEYDGLGRLLLVRNHDKLVTNAYDYYYKKQD